MNTDSLKTEWFIQQSEQTLGPYSLEDMIRMKQNHKLYDHDYVWANHLPGWTRAYYVAELKLTGSEPAVNRRRYPRFDVELDCYISNSHYAYQGQIKSLSQGGLLVEAHHPHLQIGQEVVLLAKPNLFHPNGFVKKGRVVNKQFIPHKVQFKSSCQYIVTFNEEDPSVVSHISDNFKSQGGLL
jgi:hypothetical protein